MNLYINYYVDKNPDRQAELDFCLQRNLEHPAIDRIICFVAEQHVQALEEVTDCNQKITFIEYNLRPSYNRFFYCTKLFPVSDYNIIANTDIYFNETLKKIELLQWRSQTRPFALALSRWDMLPQKRLIYYNHPDSQDVWIFRGRVEPISGAEFTLGRAGCDNKIAYLLEQAGHNVQNPSHEIQAIHLHNTPIRNYNVAQDHRDIRPPFKIVHPCYINQL